MRDLALVFAVLSALRVSFSFSQEPTTPVISRDCKVFRQSVFSSVFKAVRTGNGRGSVAMLAAALHVMFQGHGCCGVPRCRLRLLDVLGHVVEISQNGGTEPARCDGFFKVDILLDPLAHFSRLRVGQWLLTTQNEVLPCAASQIWNDLRYQVNHAATGICLRSLQQRFVSVRMCNSTLNANRLLRKVNVLPLQSQDFFRT